MSVDVFALQPALEEVGETLETMRASNVALGDFLNRQWEELDRLRRELGEQAHSLAHREREVERKEHELAATLKLAKLYTELSEMRCGPLNQQQDQGKVDAALLAASARIIELEQKVAAASDATRTTATTLPVR